MPELVFAVGFILAALAFGVEGFFAWAHGESLPQQIYGAVMLVAAAGLANAAFLCELIRINRSKAAPDNNRELEIELRALCSEFEWQRKQIEAHRKKKELAAKP